MGATKNITGMVSSIGRGTKKVEPFPPRIAENVDNTGRVLSNGKKGCREALEARASSGDQRAYRAVALSHIVYDSSIM